MLQELTETAYHEAGHAVLMNHYKFVVESVEVKWNHSTQQWDGKTQRKNSKQQITVTEDGENFFDPNPLLEGSMIAMAGCLAQTKYISRQANDDTVFSSNQNWENLFGWMNDNNPENQLPFSLQFETQGKIVSVDAVPRSFGGIDRTIYLREREKALGFPLYASKFQPQLQESILETMELFDESETWERVSCLSKALVEGCTDEKGFKISDGIEQYLD